MKKKAIVPTVVVEDNQIPVTLQTSFTVFPLKAGKHHICVSLFVK